MNYVFLATGFEEIEAVTPIDVMHRAGMKTTIVSVTPGQREVTGANGVTYLADTTIEKAGDCSDAEWIVLPGGMPGATNLYECEELVGIIRKHAAKGRKIAAICASPAVVLGQLGLLKGKHATCYPGFEELCEGAVMNTKPVVVDGNLVTGWGPSASLPWAYTIVAEALGKETSAAVSVGMLFDKTYAGVNLS